MNLILLAAFVGIGIGIVVGALGAGGGILSVPVLVYLLGLNPHDATGASLVVVGITAIVALRHPIKKKNVAWKEGLIFGACSVVGAAIAARLSVLVPEHALMMAFGTLLLAVSVVMFRRGRHTRRQENEEKPSLEAEVENLVDEGEMVAQPTVASKNTDVRVLPLVLAATFTGVLTGFFGVGGGFLAVPMLVLALHLPIRVASGTSLLVMIMSSSSAFLSRLGTPMDVPWLPILLFTAGSALGGVIGGPISARVRPSTLTFCFAFLLLAIGLFTLFIN